jgi:hypothetical protein
MLRPRESLHSAEKPSRATRTFGRAPKPLTAEQLEAARVKAEREEFRRKEVDAIRAIDPACEVESDPPVKWCVPKVVADSPTGVLLDLPRKSGRGLSGSRLVLAARSYDGTGALGGEPAEYVTVHVNFRDVGGHLRRTQGVAIRPGELRAVAQTLLDMADRYGVKA